MLVLRSGFIIASIAILLTSGLLFFVRQKPSEARFVAHSDFWDGSSDIHLRIPGKDYDVNLTHHPAHDTQPTWSPDGQWIAFASDREMTREGGKTIDALYIMRPDGSDLHKVGLSSPATGTRVVSWSADSQWLYSRYVTRGWWDSYVVRVADGYSETLRHDTTFTLYAAWSPQNDSLAYRTGVDNDRLTVLGRATPVGDNGLLDTQVLINSEDFIHYLAWSPDGQQIAYLSHTRNPVGRYFLSLLSLKENSEQLLYESATPFVDLVWSGDGQWLSFLTGDMQKVALYQMRMGDAPMLQNEPMLEQAGLFGRLAWSPDNQWLTLVVGTETGSDIYQLKPDGSQPELVHHNNRPIHRLAWSSDGEMLYFGTGQREQTQLYQMQPDGSDLQYLTDVAFEWDIPVSPIIDSTWQGWPLFVVGLIVGSLAFVPKIRYFHGQAENLTRDLGINSHETIRKLHHHHS